MPSKATPATRPWPITETPPKKSSASPLVKRRDDGLFEGFDNLESQPTVYDVRKDMGKEAAQQLRSKVAAFSSSAERASDELKPRWLSGPLKPNALAHPLSKSGQAFADRPWQKHSGSVLLMPRGSNDSPRSGSPAPPRSSSPRAGALVAANAELGKQLEREAATRSAAAAPAPTAAAAVTPAGKPSKRYEAPPPTLPKSPLPPYEGGESRAMVWDPEQRCLKPMPTSARGGRPLTATPVRSVGFRCPATPKEVSDWQLGARAQFIARTPPEDGPRAISVQYAAEQRRTVRERRTSSPPQTKRWSPPATRSELLARTRAQAMHGTDVARSLGQALELEVPGLSPGGEPIAPGDWSRKAVDDVEAQARRSALLPSEEPPW